MSTVSLVIASIAVSAVFTVSFGYLYVTERKVYALFWLLSLAVLTSAYLARLAIIISGNETSLALLVNFISTICGYWLLYKGICLFLGKKDNQAFFHIAAVLSLTYVVVLLSGFSTTLVLSAASLDSAALLASAGFISVSSPKIKDPIKYMLGIAFLAWSAATLSYTFSRTLALIPVRYSYITVGIAGMLAIMCTLASYFISIREEMLINEDRIRKLVMFDKLTGAYNRAHFEEITAVFFDRFTLPVVLAMADINGLKLVNDTFGHKEGDELLITAVAIIKKSIGENDMIVRWGGDEFIIVMPLMTKAAAELTVGKIKAECRSYCSSTIPLDMSIGLSTIDVRGCDIGKALRQAEEKMYGSKLNDSKQTRRDIIDFLQKILWEKDFRIKEHVLRLKDMAIETGRRLGLSAKEIDELAQVALLHDIGKIAIPDEILNKKEPFTPAEWEIIRKHSETGYRIAQSSRELANISEAILGHHEWWNGCGYPQSLKGKDIPQYSRIISIIDTYDVITHDRPYKKAIGKEEALSEILAGAGIQYDPFLVKIFAGMMNEK